MRVNLTSVGRFGSFITIAVMLALALVNAQCYFRCLLQACDTTSTPCHSHGPTKSVQCVQQHDVKTPPAHATVVDWTLAGPIFTEETTVAVIQFSESAVPSPTPPTLSVILPIRI
jgi:hypothetical protein